MNQLATDFLKAKFYSGQITGEELMRRVEAEVRREVAAEIEQIRGERDETAKELAKEKADHADTQHKWNEALDVGLKVVKERDALRTAIDEAHQLGLAAKVMLRKGGGEYVARGNLANALAVYDAAQQRAINRSVT